MQLLVSHNGAAYDILSFSVLDNTNVTRSRWSKITESNQIEFESLPTLKYRYLGSHDGENIPHVFH